MLFCARRLWNASRQPRTSDVRMQAGNRNTSPSTRHSASDSGASPAAALGAGRGCLLCWGQAREARRDGPAWQPQPREPHAPAHVQPTVDDTGPHYINKRIGSCCAAIRRRASAAPARAVEGRARLCRGGRGCGGEGAAVPAGSTAGGLGEWGLREEGAAGPGSDEGRRLPRRCRVEDERAGWDRNATDRTCCRS